MCVFLSKPCDSFNCFIDVRLAEIPVIHAGDEQVLLSGRAGQGKPAPYAILLDFFERMYYHTFMNETLIRTVSIKLDMD